MGFVNPGNSKKRKLKSKSTSRDEAPNNAKLNVKKRKVIKEKPAPSSLVTTPKFKHKINEAIFTKDLLNETASLTNLEQPNAIEPGEEQEFIPDHPLSLLEKLPVEVLLEIFILSLNTQLPFASKYLNHHLRSSLSLKREMVKMYHYDLNELIVKRDSCHEFTEEDVLGKVRFALDSKLLDYKFITGDVLATFRYEVIIPFDTIKKERIERYKTYIDKLNKGLIEALMARETSPEEINRELARMAEERFEMFVPEAPVALEPIENNEEQLEDDQNVEANQELELQRQPQAQGRGQEGSEQEPEQEGISKSTDLPSSFYAGPFDLQKLSQIHQLTNNTNLKYHNLDLLLSQAISQDCTISTLQALVKFSKNQRIKTSEPIISAFERDHIEVVKWLFTICQDFEEMKCDDSLWIYIGRKKNDEFLKIIEELGGSPGAGALNVLSLGGL